MNAVFRDLQRAHDVLLRVLGYRDDGVGASDRERYKRGVHAALPTNPVLRHDEDDAPPPLADFPREFTKRGRGREVQQGIGRAAVPIAA